MMQGTLLTGIRGNDLDYSPKMKPVVRWIRSNLLNNGNPENDFMEVGTLPAVEDFEDELEYMSVHYFRHLILTLEIIGYKHPDYDVSTIAMEYYLRLVNWCHLAPESHEELNERLSGEPGTTGTTKMWVAESRKVLPAPEPSWQDPLNKNWQLDGNGNWVTIPTPSQPQPPVHRNQGSSSYS
jgi:hypothetical protein